MRGKRVYLPARAADHTNRYTVAEYRNPKKCPIPRRCLQDLARSLIILRVSKHIRYLRRVTVDKSSTHYEVSARFSREQSVKSILLLR